MELEKINESNVNQRDNQGRTPLFLTAFHNLPEFARKFLDMGADPNVKDNFGSTAIQVAWENFDKNFSGDHGSQTAKLIWEHGIDLSYKDKNCRNLVHWAVEKNRCGPLRILIDAGANINAVDINGDTPLHLSIKSNLNEISSILVDSSIDVNLEKNNGNTYLHCLCESFDFVRHNQLVAKLIDKGAQVDKKNHRGLTPLHQAIRYHNQEIALILLERQANPNEPYVDKSNHGKLISPLQLTSKSSTLTKLQMLLLAYGADLSNWPEAKSKMKISALKAACILGLTKRAVELIDQGEVTKKSKKSDNLVDVAIAAGNQETAAAMQAALARKEIQSLLSDRSKLNPL